MRVPTDFPWPMAAAGVVFTFVFTSVFSVFLRHSCKIDGARLYDTRAAHACRLFTSGFFFSLVILKYGTQLIQDVHAGTHVISFVFLVIYVIWLGDFLLDHLLQQHVDYYQPRHEHIVLRKKETSDDDEEEDEEAQIVVERHTDPMGWCGFLFIWWGQMIRVGAFTMLIMLQSTTYDLHIATACCLFMVMWHASDRKWRIFCFERGKKMILDLIGLCFAMAAVVTFGTIIYFHLILKVVPEHWKPLLGQTITFAVLAYAFGIMTPSWNHIHTPRFDLNLFYMTLNAFGFLIPVFF